MAKCNIKASNVALEWSNICKELTSQQAVRLLHRFTSGLINLPPRIERISSDSCSGFLEKRVAYDFLEGKKLLNSNNLSFSKSLDILQHKIIDLNDKSLLKPKDVSLSLNSYAKFYQNLHSNRSYNHLYNLIPTDNIKRYVSQLLSIANKNIQHMNEQDLSLVLNCISKINVNHDAFLKSSNKLLYNSLQEFYRKGLTLEDDSSSDNLMKNITPQGVSLLLNCFSKSNIELDPSVLDFFVDEYVGKLVEKFQINQLIVTLNSFLKFKIPLTRVFKAVKTADIMLKESEKEYNMKLISTSLYTFAKYNYQPIYCFRNIVSYLDRVNLKHSSELELGNIYYAFGKLNYRNTKLIDKMNENVYENLKTFTPHGVVGIYHSLSKLDYKSKLFSQNEKLQNMENRFISEFLKFFKDDLSLAGVNNSNFNIPVVPLHNINFCFSCSINNIVDHKIYSLLLRKLTCMIENEPSSPIFKIGNIVLNYREELTNDHDQFKFLSKYIGIQGIYQLYCILQHVLNYVERGLESIEYSVLASINSLMDHFNILSTGKRRKFFTEDLIFEPNKVEDDVKLDETTHLTSKIHEDVYSVLEKIAHERNEDNNQPGLDGNESSGLANDKSILYKEHEALPYTIDIVLFKF
ncbi:hypothetical protein TpMuguga_01g00271 [Theileria parva strain Muguga]|uniref:uncharacterized protein n=1 Tax=Theileria parva strain Muguga TaxID=333668 RepID=UPI001C622822|nr:uncharacterized protein TpMuguga_01g00271 [Theileria parva strain Muguga]EAN33515.2 hypothetical protein TpMuguga_01g00271 [Theileria parva strain Muguga]